jgi:BirA family biotin operon repressor/biotin-[acetyl-CoA-carboxylase] ligase
VSDLLDREKILVAMSGESRAQAQSLLVAVETTSTQDDALAAPTPRTGCAVFLAERQSAGQGRRGRAWASPHAANLYMSLSRHFGNELAALSGLSLVVGVVAAETLNVLASRSRLIAVKWPNDLVADGRKLGGILISLRGAAEGGADAVIGIGINVRMPAQAAHEIDQPWCDLSQLGYTDCSRNDLVAALLDRLLPALDQFERDGLAPFLARWQALDALAGKPVRILDGAREHEGIFSGITDAGALCLRQGERDVIFHSGEVSLRTA